MGGHELDVLSSGWAKVVGCCKHGNDLSDFTNCRQFLDQCTDYSLLCSCL